MILRDLLQLVLFIGLLAALSPLLGRYVHQVFSGRRTFLHPVLGSVERGVYSLSGIHPDENQTWSRYAVSLIGFSLAGFLLTFGVLLFQDKLPLNPQGFPGLSWDLALNTAVSFLTNTNWQSYGGETTMSHFSQMVALTYQNFVSAAVGIAVCAAVVRGIARNESSSIGNFWSDLVRITLYVLLPLSIIGALIMLWQGMVQNFDAGVTATTLEGGKQFIATGPVASQIAIKLLGTNGGGFFNVNAAHPFENPTALASFLQSFYILIIPSALVFFLGDAAGSRRHAWTVWAVMLALFIGGVLWIYFSELHGTHLLQQIAGGAVPNMEGKEVRFGVFGTSLFATATTDASCGAVNAMHDSLTPLGGMLVLFNMLLGEIIYGGVGSGLYGMILFILLTVFIAGLMVGRTPDYLGKRIEGREITWCMVALLACATPILCFSAVAAVSSWGTGALNNAGAHGLSEILYAFTSGAQNNGSAFAGLSANVPVWNVLLALAMFIGRFGVMLSMLVVAGSLAARKKRPISDSSFPVEGPTFGLLLLGIIFIVGALTYLPALSLGPIVEQFQMMRGMMF